MTDDMRRFLFAQRPDQFYSRLRENSERKAKMREEEERQQQEQQNSKNFFDKAKNSLRGIVKRTSSD